MWPNELAQFMIEKHSLCEDNLVDEKIEAQIPHEMDVEDIRNRMNAPFWNLEF